MYNRSNQSGFTALQATLVFIIVSILGGTAYFVAHMKQASDNAYGNVDIFSEITAPVTIDSVAFSNLPSTLQSTIISHAKSTNSRCVSRDNRLLNSSGNPVVRYISGKFAQLDVCNTPNIYVHSSGGWFFAAETELDYSCSILEKYTVPVKLILRDGNSQCVDESENIVTYPRS